LRPLEELPTFVLRVGKTKQGQRMYCRIRKHDWDFWNLNNYANVKLWVIARAHHLDHQPHVYNAQLGKQDSGGRIFVPADVFRAGDLIQVTLVDEGVVDWRILGGLVYGSREICDGCSNPLGEMPSILGFVDVTTPFIGRGLSFHISCFCHEFGIHSISRLKEVVRWTHVTTRDKAAYEPLLKSEFESFLEGRENSG
jgi:hypothetical protein